MKVLKTVVGLACLCAIFMLLIYLALYRFIEPSLTETQLFLKIWWKALFIIPLIVGFEWGLFENKKK